MVRNYINYFGSLLLQGENSMVVFLESEHQVTSPFNEKLIMASRDSPT